MIRKAKAVWRGTGRAGDGNLSTESGVCPNPILLQNPFRKREGHKSGGIDRRRSRWMLYHGAGFSAADRWLHPKRTEHRGRSQP